MRRIVVGAIVVSGSLVLMAGCASSRDWLFGKRDAPAEAPREVVPAEAGSEVARVEPAERAPAAVTAEADGRTETVDVRFGFDRADLTDAARAELLHVAKKLGENPRLVVHLEGYADSVGKREYNLALSRKRVEAVRAFLVEQGIEAARIRTVTVGQLPDGGTPEERARNRRVTVKLTVDTASR